MKSEIEFKWIVNLLNSKYLKGGFIRKQIGGCKRDFEVEAGASENDKEFRKWINLLIEEGILEFFKKKSVGTSKMVDTYVIKYNELESLLHNNPLCKPAKKVFDKDRII